MHVTYSFQLNQRTVSQVTENSSSLAQLVERSAFKQERGTEMSGVRAPYEEVSFFADAFEIFFFVFLIRCQESVQCCNYDNDNTVIQLAATKH